MEKVNAKINKANKEVKEQPIEQVLWAAADKLRKIWMLRNISMLFLVLYF